MFNQRNICFLIVIGMLLLIGCSEGKTPVIPGKENVSQDSLPIANLIEGNGITNGLGLMGAYVLTINPKDMSAELINKRISSIGESYIVSGLSFFTMAPCQDCLNLSGVAYDGIELTLSFTISHPFDPGLPHEPPTATNRLDLNVFDLAMVVAPVDETPELFNGIGASVYTSSIDNADGYTTELANMLDDVAAMPYVLVVDDSDTGISTWNLFAMGAETDFDVSFNFEPGESLVFDMYLTMGYGASAVKATRLEPQYYNPEFNRNAAWKVVVEPPNGTLPPDQLNTWVDNDPETEHFVTVKVYDWQQGATVNPELVNPTDVYAASEVETVEVEIIGMNLASVAGTAHDGTGTGMAEEPLVYTIPIANEGLLTAGDYVGLVKVTDQRATGTVPPTGDRDFLINSPDGIELVNYEMPEYATYQTFPLTVVMGFPGVVFQQMDYSFDGETVTDSAFGNVRVNYMDNPDVKFFNLTVDGVWSVQNMPLVSWRGPGFMHSVNISFDLNVPDGTDVTSFGMGWSVDDFIQPGGPLETGTGYVYTGTASGYPGRSPSTFMLPIFPQDPEIRGANMPPATCVGPIYTNNECGPGECVPAAVSNSLEYLQQTQGEPPPGKLTSVDSMKPAVGWTAENNTPGGWADTKDQYMNDNGYNINTNQYPDPDDMNHEATEAECDAAMADVAAGNDVEINGGHHTAAITSMVKGTDDAGNTIYTITVRHDTDQDNPGGCQEDTIVYTPPQGGNPSSTTGGTPGFFSGDDINGFVAESAA